MSRECDNCPNPARGRTTLCNACRLRLQRNGSLRHLRGKPLEFLQIALAKDIDDCILWPFSKDSDGYGHLRIDGVLVKAHNEVLRAVEPPPEGKQLALHTCYSKSCINKNHLYWGDYQDNVADRIEAKGR